MKKLLAIILLVAVLLPVIALADPDPIVGCWYIHYDKSVTPELAVNFQDYDRIIAVYCFFEDGTIACLECDVIAGNSTPTYGGAGKWEKNGTEYSYSILGFGSGRCFIREGSLYLGLSNNAVYLMVRKLEPMNPYKDYVPE